MNTRTYIDNAQLNRAVSSKTLAGIRKTVINSLEYMNITFPCEISIKLVSPEEIRELNKTFRGIDEETDVLSFPSGEYSYGDDPQLKRNERLFLGDMAICVEIAYRQSYRGHSPRMELELLTAHSMLHLFGFDHRTKREEKAMFAKQNEILNMRKP
ncbi:MAG: rRNA maturation RNase YbeY [Clostridia bacterium]|nr:rRNA maturation RNase YbeY [Clostridia bacterium]